MTTTLHGTMAGKKVIDPIVGNAYHEKFSEAKLNILIGSFIKYAEYNLAPRKFKKETRSAGLLLTILVPVSVQVPPQPWQTSTAY